MAVSMTGIILAMQYQMTWNDEVFPASSCCVVVQELL
jgi:hypothetical protein